jgi:hypothetical protein
VTISLNINKARLNSTVDTIELQVELEAINYGQSVMELVANLASTEEGYTNLESKFNNWQSSSTFPDGSGRTLYSKVLVSSEASNPTIFEVPNKLVTVSVYSDQARTKLLTRYKSTFNSWW